MGGTSTDVCLVRGGVAEISAERELDGLPVGLPSIDIANVGAGGGSLAWIDRGGMLQVGPRSAGARPGPACYGHGGTEAAVTDALVQLGWMRPAHFLGGRMPLFPERVDGGARAAGRQPAARISPASRKRWWPSRVANISRAVRLVSVQRGHDPKHYALYAYGGMGPMVGALVAERDGDRPSRRAATSGALLGPRSPRRRSGALLSTDARRAANSGRRCRRSAAIFDRLRADAESEYAGYGYRPEQVEIVHASWRCAIAVRASSWWCLSSSIGVEHDGVSRTDASVP